MTAPADAPWTVLRLLEWTTGFFKQRGSDSPRLDAEVLLAHARGCDRIQLYTAFNEVPSDTQRTTFRELVRRRGEGTPVAHLVGYREFYSLRLRVNEQVLIPRPETEHVVVAALDAAKERSPANRPLKIADVGTGSGAIAIALAKHLPEADITALERSGEALEVAAENVRAHGVDERIRLVRSDLFEALAADERFDVICSNPPYVSDSEYEQLEATVRDHEPREALVAGPTGAEVIERLLAVAPVRLEPGGLCLIELSPMIAERCLAAANEIESLTDAKLIRDLAGRHRVLAVQRR